MLHQPQKLVNEFIVTRAVNSENILLTHKISLTFSIYPPITLCNQNYRTGVTGLAVIGTLDAVEDEEHN